MGPMGPPCGPKGLLGPHGPRMGHATIQNADNSHPAALCLEEEAPKKVPFSDSFALGIGIGLGAPIANKLKKVSSFVSVNSGRSVHV